MATEKVQVNVYLEKSIVRKLDEARKGDGLSRSAIVGRLVRRYLRKRDEKILAAGNGGRRVNGPKGTGT
jgi:metal-responsive CopG/Arc/MetJ family transcriptional regulator